MDLASLYITAHPQLEWLASSEKQDISDYGFRYTKEEKKKYWRTIGSGAVDYMSEWHKIHLECVSSGTIRKLEWILRQFKEETRRLSSAKSSLVTQKWHKRRRNCGLVNF